MRISSALEDKEHEMKKFRLYFDKDKEEIWLNEMCRDGWAMTGFFMGVYTFVPCKPGEYTYQIDMPIGPGKGSRKGNMTHEYIALVEETGAEYVCSWGWWVFFRKETAKGTFKLYTDTESQIKLYQRIRLLFLAVGLYEVAVCIFNTNNFVHRLEEMENIGTLLAQDGSGWLLFLTGMGILYLITLVFLVMITKLTLKIHQLKKLQ